MGSRMPLYASIALLMVISIIELSFVSSTVGFLHGTASGTFPFTFDGSTAQLKGEPKHLLVDQGHTSNAASGTAFILVGIGGIITLFLRNRPNPSRFSIYLHHLWVVINVLALFLTFGALIYVFTVTDEHKGQSIDPSVAAKLDGKPYDVDLWTPQGWFSAVLKLDLEDADQKSKIKTFLSAMRGWQYNLIPFFIIQACETVLAVWDAIQRRMVPRTAENSEKNGSSIDA